MIRLRTYVEECINFDLCAYHMFVLSPQYMDDSYLYYLASLRLQSSVTWLAPLRRYRYDYSYITLCHPLSLCPTAGGYRVYPLCILAINIVIIIVPYIIVCFASATNSLPRLHFITVMFLYTDGSRARVWATW